MKRGAAFVTLTDYPDPAIVHNLERNWFENLVETAEEKQERLEVRAESIHTTRYTSLLGSSSVNNQERHNCEKRVRCAVRGHAWGESVQEMLGLPGSGSGSPTGYDWILMADTLWVSEGHGALLSSCLAVLSPGGRILVCCGLHSGFNTVQRFMALARSSTFGFQVRLVEIRRVPQWGETRTAEELRAESAQLKEEDMEKFAVEDRNRTVLVYELWK